jgi:hypothetical protein
MEDGRSSPFVPFENGQRIEPKLAISLDGMINEWGGIKYAELSVALVGLKFLQTIHQAHHWIAKGDTFYGDHQLFQWLYDTVTTEIDALAEKAVGLGSERNVDVLLLNRQLERLLTNRYGSSSTIPQVSEFARRSLEAEQWFVGSVDVLVKKIEGNAGLMTLGLENMLAGLADAHEGHIYLLRQRCAKGSL